MMKNNRVTRQIYGRNLWLKLIILISRISVCNHLVLISAATNCQIFKIRVKVNVLSRDLNCVWSNDKSRFPIHSFIYIYYSLFISLLLFTILYRVDISPSFFVFIAHIYFQDRAQDIILTINIKQMFTSISNLVRIELRQKFKASAIQAGIEIKKSLANNTKHIYLYTYIVVYFFIDFIHFFYRL